MDYECLMKPALKEMPLFRGAMNTRDVMARYGLESVTRMAANENQFGPSPMAMEAMRAAVASSFQYPDRQAELTQAIAAKYCVTEGSIVLSAGATGVLNLLGDVFLGPGDEAVMSSIPYMQYPILVRRNGATPVQVPVLDDLSQDLDGMCAAVTGKTKLIMVCNPGNPTSIAEDSDRLEAFIRRVPESVLVMIDEAYLDFVDDPQKSRSMLGLVAEIPNLVVVRTFSKLYGMAGMRVGFMVASPSVVQCVTRGGTVGNVNQLGLAAATAALSDLAHEKLVRDGVLEGRRYLTGVLESCGFRVYPSGTNFLYFDTGLDVEGMLTELLKRGIIIRNFAYNRVSIGTREQNERFAQAILEIMESGVLAPRAEMAVANA